MRDARFLHTLLLLLVLAPALQAQTAVVHRMEAEPSRLVVTAGDSVRLRVTAYDAAGQAIGQPVIRLAASRAEIDVRPWYESGRIVARTAGTHRLLAVAPGPNGRPVQLEIPVVVEWPAVSSVDVGSADGRLYAGTTLRHTARASHSDGSERPDPSIVWSTSDPAVATVDAHGYVTAAGTGSVTITAEVDGAQGTLEHEVQPFPEATLELSREGDGPIRTGDVQRFEALLDAADGADVSDVPITWSLRYEPASGDPAPAAPGHVKDGRFVADVPGVYTVFAHAGPLTARTSLRVEPRDVVRKVDVLGQGQITDHYTSDVWVFEGVDGRDYALTGSRQGESHAYVWDVTDPTAIVKTDSIQVDARSVNDVKASPDGRYAVISREGASTRRNGVVILDMETPAHPVIASVYDEGLTGGVHNVFALNDYLFALSGGDKYVILDMRDIYNPRYVSEYDHPDSRIHDVWVHDGIAYSAEWETGVVVVDVGNGRWGGSIENPVFVTSFPLPTGATHAVFPYYQEDTGTFYLFVGDEIISREGLPWQGTGPDFRMPYDPETGRGGYPRATSGYIQIVDFTDPENPEMVARYEVKEYGTHNIWVEDDVLYQAYYEGGVRIVDVSGELMGNLYTQDREIAVYKAHDPTGWIANAPAAWSVMPYKGNIFFSDNTSGLWSIRLQPRGNLTP